jgi:hypothetical protein
MQSTSSSARRRAQARRSSALPTFSKTAPTAARRRGGTYPAEKRVPYAVGEEHEGGQHADERSHATPGLDARETTKAGLDRQGVTGLADRQKQRPGARGHHRRASRAHGGDDLLGIDPLEVDRGDAKAGTQPPTVSVVRGVRCLPRVNTNRLWQSGRPPWEPGHDRLADDGGKRQPLLATALATDDELAGAPVRGARAAARRSRRCAAPAATAASGPRSRVCRRRRPGHCCQAAA